MQSDLKPLDQELMTLVGDNGFLDPDIIIEAARDKKSFPALWAHFDKKGLWNRERAAARALREEATSLYRRVKVIYSRIEEGKTRIIARSEPLLIKDPRYDRESRVIPFAEAKRLPAEDRYAILLREVTQARGSIQRAKSIAFGLGYEGLLDGVAAQIELVFKGLKSNPPKARVAKKTATATRRIRKAPAKHKQSAA